jgi:hypothetical protein
MNSENGNGDLRIGFCPERIGAGDFGLRSRLVTDPARIEGRLSTGLGCASPDRLNQPDLLGVDDLEMTSVVIQQHGLPIRTDHEVIRVGDHERLLITQHDSDWPEGLRLHQLLDLICDHGAKSSRGRAARQTDLKATCSDLHPERTT